MSYIFGLEKKKSIWDWKEEKNTSDDGRKKSKACTSI